MWATLASLVLGAVPGVIRELAKAKVDLANAQTEHEKVEANERIKALEAKRDVLIAESNTPWNALTRALILLPFIIYINWVIIWDKIACKWFLVEGVCKTDPLSDWLSGILGMGLGYVFVTDISKIWKR